MKSDRLAKLHLLPCVVCQVLGVKQTSPTEAHHCKHLPNGKRIGMGHKRASDDHTIPLCWDHHWNGVHNPMSYKAFCAITRYDEPMYWAIANEMLRELEDA